MNKFADEKLKEMRIKYIRYAENGFWAGSRKNAMYFYINPITEIRRCELCGKISTPKKIQSRSDIFHWDSERKDYTKKNKSMLCMGCYNKIKPLVYKKRDIDDLIKLQKAIIRKVRKHEKDN